MEGIEVLAVVVGTRHAILCVSVCGGVGGVRIGG